MGHRGEEELLLLYLELTGNLIEIHATTAANRLGVVAFYSTGRTVGNEVAENRASSRDLRKMTNQGVIDLQHSHSGVFYPCRITLRLSQPYSLPSTSLANRRRYLEDM